MGRGNFIVLVPLKKHQDGYVEMVSVRKLKYLYRTLYAENYEVNHVQFLSEVELIYSIVIHKNICLRLSLIYRIALIRVVSYGICFQNMLISFG